MSILPNARNVNFNGPTSLAAVGVINNYYVAGNMIQVQSGAQHGETPMLPSKLLTALPCPTPSQYFTGRVNALRKLSKMLAAPVFTLFSTNGDTLRDTACYIHDSSRFSSIFLDASSIETLKRGIKEMMPVINTDNDGVQSHANTLLVLEKANVSLQLDQHLPYSLHNPILLLSTDETVSRFASPDCAFEMPGSIDQLAVDSLLQSIEESFTSRQRVVTLVAKGGTGKTQVAYKLVAESPSRFSYVWVFDGTSDTTLIAAFKKLGEAAGVGESVNDVKNFLQGIHENWLLIFDNSDDPNVDLSDYIPHCNHGNVIITSRLTEVNQMASPGFHIDLLDLEHEEAIELLLKRIHGDYSNNNRQLASDIVDTFGCQALAVATAGAYIASTATCTLGNYLSLFERKRTQLLNYKMKSLDHYQRTIFSAFLLSFEQLSPATRLLMQICSFFSPAAIPIGIFYYAHAFTGKGALPGEDILGVVELEHFLSLFADNESWNDSVNELASFSLTTYDTNTESLSFHSILHACASETIQVTDNKEGQVALLLLARGTPLGNNAPDFQFRRQLVVHADHIYQEDFSTHLVCHAFGIIFHDAGDWKKAESMWQQDVSCCKIYLGEHHPMTLSSMSQLAWTYRNYGKLQMAEKLEEDVLQFCEKVLGEHHPSTLVAINNLALTYDARGKMDKAKELLEKVLKLFQKVSGNHHPDTLTSMHNLAMIYQTFGRIEESKKLHEKVLKLCLEVLGQHHPNTMTSMHNLAITYRLCGRMQEAKKLHEEVFKLRLEMLGENHPDTSASMATLACTYSYCGLLKEAVSLEEKVLKIRIATLGEQHPQTIETMNNIALTYTRCGQMEKAAKLQYKALELTRSILGEHHPDTLACMNNLASTHRQCGHWEEAVALYQNVIELGRKVLGMHHPAIWTFVAGLASTYRQCALLEDAETLEETILVVRREILGERHPDTSRSMHNLALTYRECGKLEEAEKLMTTAVSLRKEIFGPDHPDSMDSAQMLHQWVTQN